MSLIKKITDFFAIPGSRETPSTWIYVRCDDCGEKLHTRINLANDLSLRYGDSTKSNTYFTRKTLIGSRLCFKPIEVVLTFDNKRGLIDRQITGGQFITKEEFESEQSLPSARQG